MRFFHRFCPISSLHGHGGMAAARRQREHERAEHRAASSLQAKGIASSEAVQFFLFFKIISARENMA